MLTACALLALAGCNGAGEEQGTEEVERVSSALTTLTGVSGGVRVNCGLAKTDTPTPPFIADTNSSGGSTKTRTGTIDLSGVTNPAPAQVYLSQRYGTFSYTFFGLQPNSINNIRLHFAETNPADNAVGKRKFNVAINGTTVLSNFDIYATVHAIDKAYIYSNNTVAADSTGQYVIQFTTVADAATVSGIEVIPTPTAVGTLTKGNTAWPVQAYNGAALNLLMDGRVLYGQGYQAAWYTLSPDSNGMYANGTWQPAAWSHFPRTFAPSNMLKTGKFVIAGGEYVEGTSHQSLEIYDPVANTWTSGPDMAQVIADTASSILPDGRWYVSNAWTDASTNFYDPTTNTWKPGPSIGTGGSGDEKGWTLMQNGKILDVWQFNASIFDITANGGAGAWTAPASYPAVSLVSPSSEIGPMSLLYSGKVIQWGAASHFDANGNEIADVGHTAIYDPATNSFYTGPDAPDGLQWGDTCASVMRNGHVLIASSPTLESGGGSTAIYEYDPYAPVDDAFSMVITNKTNPANPSATRWAADPKHPANQVWVMTALNFPLFLQLPSGETLLYEANDISHVYTYTPAAGPNATWLPTVTSVSGPSSTTYTLTGKQLNGLTQGATFGDDRNLFTNYPIVSLTNTSTNQVFYARAHDIDQMTPRPNTTGTVKFELPTTIPTGTYKVGVSANGVASTSTASLSVTENHVTSVSGPSVAPGGSSTWTVTLANAVTAQTTVFLSSDNNSVATPALSQLIIPAGAKSGTVGMLGRGFGSAHISATLALTQFPPAVGTYGWNVDAVGQSFWDLSRPSYLGPTSKSTTWTVQISAPAPAGGVVVNLASSQPGAFSLAGCCVTVPAGQQSATFVVSKSSAFATSATITASLINSSKTNTIGMRVRGDANGDSRSDITLAGGTSFSNIMPQAWADGDGTWQGVTGGEVQGDTSFAADALVTGAKAVDGDFNDDGNADIALVGGTAWTTIPLALSFGNGTYLGSNSATVAAGGGFAAPDKNFPAYATTAGVQPVSGDFNGDGKTDIALTGPSGWGTIPVAFSEGNGVFQCTNGGVTGVNFPSLASTAGVTALAGDFDGDGAADIALVGVGTRIPVAFSLHGANQVGTFNAKNGGARSTGEEAGFQTNALVEGARAIAGDFNRDGKTDLALIGGLGWTGIQVALSDGDGGFHVVAGTLSGDTLQNVYADQNGAKLVAGDFDGDGVDDIALAGGVGWQSMPVTFGDGDGMSFHGTNLNITSGDTSFYAYGSTQGAQPSTTYRMERVVKFSKAAYDTTTQCTVGGKTMHCCPSGQALIGLKASTNQWKCAPLTNATGARSLDTGTVRFDMHTCPFGQVMVGVDITNNLLACQTLPGTPVTKEDTDSGSNDVSSIHVCNDTMFSAMTGIRADHNIWACAVGN